jgi:hypothetical protein
MSEVAQSTNFLNMATEDEEHVTEEEAGMMADLIVNAMRKKAREDREAEQEELAAVVNAADETSSASSSASSNSKRSRECNSETREAEAEEEEEEEEVTDFAIFEETDYCGGCDYALKLSSEELRFFEDGKWYCFCCYDVCGLASLGGCGKKGRGFKSLGWTKFCPECMPKFKVPVTPPSSEKKIKKKSSETRKRKRD